MLKFQKKRYYIKSKEFPVVINPDSTNKKRNYNERDLHPLLTYFAFHNNHFNWVTKTIYHETSDRRNAERNKWIHPDLVGAYLSFSQLADETIELSKLFYDGLYRLFFF